MQIVSRPVLYTFEVLDLTCILSIFFYIPMNADFKPSLRSGQFQS